MVLLKNDGALPLKAGKEKVALIGCQVEDPRFLFGGYTHYSMAEGNLAVAHQKEAEGQGREPEMIPGTCIMKSDEPDYMETLRIQKPELLSFRQEMEARFPEKEFITARGYSFAGDDESGYAEAMAAAEPADTVIMMLGGKHGTRIIASMAEGTDATDVGIPAVQERLLERFRQAWPEKRIIGIHLDGRPASSDTADRCLNALLEAFSPSEAGNRALAEILAGDYNPSGKLPVSVVWNGAQCPLYYSVPNGSGFTQRGGIGIDRRYVDLPHEPRYPFGFGLSYTSFAYDGLEISTDPAEEELEVRFRVRNTGERKGTEIAQVYVRDVHASRLRPNLELVGFARAELEAGEEKQVCLRMKTGQLAFRKEGRWLLEKGEFEMSVRASSTDVRLQDSFMITRSREIDGRTRGFFMK